MRRSWLITFLSASLVLAFLTLLDGPPGVSDPAPARPAAFPALRVTVQVPHLSLPWDVQQLPGSRYLISERDTAHLLIRRNGVTRVVGFPSSSVWVSGETGLMSLAVDPDFATNRRIYACEGGFTASGGHDVRVVAYRMNAAYTGVRRIQVLVSGISTSTGRHGGCRLLIGSGGAMYVGTGDAAIGTNPQNLNSLAGKILRLDRMTGAPWPGNPWIHSANHNRRYVFNYGHRNVQGLAQRADGRLWSVEQGTDRDDEINLGIRGGNFGWNPVPGYDESTPMTDQSLPGVQINAQWSSGYPTMATCGAAWVSGKQWGSYDGTLAVATLKDSKLVFFRFTAAGRFVWKKVPVELNGTYGRLRSVTRAHNGDLLITTSNGTDDKVLRVSPL
jgi:glucose/arabinose dehydrogenase